MKTGPNPDFHIYTGMRLNLSNNTNEKNNEHLN